MKATHRYHNKFSEAVKVEVEGSEKKVRAKRKQTPIEVVNLEALQWMPDTEFSRSKDMKLFKMVEIRWLKLQNSHCPSHTRQGKPAAQRCHEKGGIYGMKI